jgi:diacylglycerol kinase (ATP)
VAERIFVVVNPRAGKGRGQRVAAAVLETLGESASVEHAFTTSPGEEALLAEQALAAGFRTLVAVGGDGTWSRVGDAIVRSGLPARLGLVAGGTGCDFAKSLDIPVADPRAAARIVLAGRVRAIDVGRVGARHFLNVAGFGYDVAVLEDSWTVSYLSGAPLYVYCALRQMGSYPGFKVRVEAEGQPAHEQDLLMLIVANARFFGGAFRIAPGAALDDGAFDLVSCANAPLPRRLALMGRLMRGTHGQAREVCLSRAGHVRLTFPEPPAFETDGEWNRAHERELVLESLPRALHVLAP